MRRSSPRIGIIAVAGMLACATSTTLRAGATIVSFRQACIA